MQHTLYVMQSNYIPWKGYFDSIDKSDLFVLFDDVQYTKGDWRNRNIIKTSNGLKWLTIPVQVSGKFTQRICDTKVAQKDWNKKHWEIIRHEYRRAECYNDVSPWLEELFLNCNFEYLTEINYYFIEEIMRFLQITTPVKFSRDINHPQEKSARLLDLCLKTNSNIYFSAPAARDYLNETIFYEKGIDIQYADYSGFPAYPQIHPPFEHKVSVIDLILNVGSDSRKYLNSTK